MVKIIFLNAPPRAGKDAIGRAICQLSQYAKIYKFADILKNRTHGFCELSTNDPDMFEHVKDHPVATMPFCKEKKRHLTPREMYILLSEKFIKPNFGEQYFGEELLKRLKYEIDFYKTTLQYCVITDSGFQGEAVPIVEHFGRDNCLLVHVTRPECSFEKLNDSRSLWSMDGLKTVYLNNDIKGQEALLSLADQILDKVNGR